MTDLGTLGGKYVHAYLINDEGVVIGNSASGTNETRWFEWTEDAGMRDIGPATSYLLRGLNNKGVAVGGMDPRWELPEWMRDFLEIKERFLGRKPRNGRAILWEKGDLHDLNDFIDPSLGYLLTDSFMFNDLGQIICVAKKGGVDHAVLLTPIEETPQ
jgi:probable HAF family extracellular repeat protein